MGCFSKPEAEASWLLSVAGMRPGTDSHSQEESSLKSSRMGPPGFRVTVGLNCTQLVSIESVTGASQKSLMSPSVLYLKGTMSPMKPLSLFQAYFQSGVR